MTGPPAPAPAGARLTKERHISQQPPPDELSCPRCRMPVPADAEFCPHCAAKVGEHRRVPWWHLHRRLYDWTIAWAYRPSAERALFALSFAESSFFPVPPDVLLMALTLGNRRKWLRLAVLCSIASVLGGALGYAIGMGLWAGIQDSVFRWLAWTGLNPRNFGVAEKYYRDYGFWVVFIAGFTPIPYKVFTILGGVCQINFAIFMVASLVSRSARFFMVAGLMRIFGPRIAPFLDRYFNLLTLLFTVMLIGGFVAMRYSLWLTLAVFAAMIGAFVVVAMRLKHVRQRVIPGPGRGET